MWWSEQMHHDMIDWKIIDYERAATRAIVNVWSEGIRQSIGTFKCESQRRSTWIDKFSVELKITAAEELIENSISTSICRLNLHTTTYAQW